jgi:hypothetical protein
LDGAGSGAAVVDAFASLSVVDLKVQDDLTVTDDVTIGGDLTVNGDTITFSSANSSDPLLMLVNNTNDVQGARLTFIKDKGAAGADGDDIGVISFIGDNDAQEQTTFAKVIAEVSDASDGAEGGKFQIQIASHDGELVDGLVLTDGSAEDEIDVTIASGTSSVTTVAGTATFGGAVEIDGNVSSTTQFSGFGGLRIHNSNGAAHNVTSDIYLTAGTASTNRGAAIGVQFTSAASGNALYFATNPGNVSSADTLVERMRIDSSGIVMVGGTTNTAGGGHLKIGDSGNDGEIMFYADQDGGQMSVYDRTNSNYEQMLYNASQHRFDISNSQKMILDSNGKLGIGITPLASTTGSGLGAAFSTLAIKASDTVTQALSIDATNPAGPNFMISSYSDGSGSYYMLGANLLLDTSGNNAWETNGENMSGITLDSRAGNGIQFITAAHDGSSYVPAERMRINSSGNVGIGQSPASSNDNFTVLGNYRSNFIRNVTSGNRGYDIAIGAVNGSGTNIIGAQIVGEVISGDADGELSFETRSSGSVTEKMRIDEDGFVMIGKTSANANVAGVEFGPAGDVTATKSSGNTYYLNDTSANKFYVNANGGIYNFQSNDSNLSDEREKKNISSLGSKWDAVKKWSLKEFHYNADADSDSKKVGVIAQDLESDHPDLVTEFDLTDTTKRKAVKEQQMTWMAIKALQEAMTRIETLEAKVATLEGS